MTRHETFPTARLATVRPISVAILAMGGQGGGVLSDWVVALAEAQGWVAQSTSVPGVAQRTGATIYYVEMLPAQDGQAPILSLMPTPGDVDVVLAAEFMEAGRSMLRGLVTPERTTLITSSHRSFAVGEKERPGNGIGDPRVVVEAAGIAAKRIIAFDMETLATKNGSVISAAMFGALAAAEVLPFPRSAFEDAVKAGGKGVDASLRAFSAAYDRTREKPRDTVSGEPEKALPPLPDHVGHAALDALVTRIRKDLPAEAHAMAFAGVKRLVDYQDVAYAGAYLDRLVKLSALDAAHGGAAKGFAFTTETAKYLAVAMAYDDVIRVADLKTRASRFDRVRREVGAKGDQIVYTTEYMHPRMEEVAGTLPAGLGRFLEARPKLFRAMDRLVNRGRRVRTGTIGWFLSLYVVASLKPIRLRTLRHEREMAHVAHWLDVATTALPQDYDLAVEAIACRRLVKGYSDTHARGQSKFDRVLAAVPMLTAKPEGAAWLRRLKQAALMDEEGKALDGALSTAESAYR
ncbi:indolepyruvate oxidoreductase subunit beta family protein [Chelatococcus asaccharovorans]|uniref:indolepyruvate oxidoreductase subunit beta family protein n=1 Tax=Chelatococcus asaccharovorans TaxID=28210 RepID=UPI00224C776B|nr:indolepyruvate oxidoreductase subunit beta family protein [Chelatococcus asaccharovorans]CAH1648795.1 Indolepyruvate oxidoreductase subunit IorB II [Chelatococcus asaccharovorans]CAH1691047.1 Indolepyruvate oxidoreductase subunit IorB II [Chelatococcus asaccharovorans]